MSWKVEKIVSSLWTKFNDVKLKIYVTCESVAGLKEQKQGPKNDVEGVTFERLQKSSNAFYFISNTFISNARLKFANFQNLSRKRLKTEL